MIFVRGHYRPQRSCGQGYVFTRVCDSVNRGACLRQTPPGSRHHPPWEQTPPRTKYTPLGLSAPPRLSTPPGLSTPPQGLSTPPGTKYTPPESRLRHTIYERPVRILLECILVFLLFTLINIYYNVTAKSRQECKGKFQVK